MSYRYSSPIRHRRWSLGVGIIALLALVISACSGSGSGNSNSLSWFFWVGSPAEASAWKHNANMVSDKYPNIHVDFSSTSWTSYWQKLPSEASTHSMPCIAGLQFGYVGSVGNDFIPLNKFVKKYHYDLKPFEKTMLSELSWNGNLLALPYDFGPVVIAYNKDMFNKKNVPLPKAGWTWSDFLSAAKKLTGGGTYGWLPGISNELAYNLTGTPDAYVQNGNFNVDNPTYIDGVKKQAELSYKYKVSPAYSTAPNWATEEFTNSKVAMEATGPWSLIDLKEQSKINLGWVEFPQGPQGMQTYNEGSGFGITKDCKTPDAAFKAITQLVNDKAESYLGSLGRAFPARLSAVPAWKKFAGGDAGDVMEGALKNAKPMEVTTNWNQFNTALTQYQPLVLSGKISAKQFAKDVQQKSGAGKGVNPGDISALINGS
jgi:multiple sugar transport system substrate-binding protein